jgi:hypothetical protein
MNAAKAEAALERRRNAGPSFVAALNPIKVIQSMPCISLIVVLPIIHVHAARGVIKGP